MKFIFLSLVFLSHSALAADWTKTNDRDIYDLMYLPNEKTKFISTSLDFLGNKTEKRVNGIKIADTENKGTALVLEGGYVPMNNLAVFLNIGYLFGSTTDFVNYDPLTGAETGSTDQSSSGASDPTLSARYRIFQQETHHVNLDIIPRFTIGTGEREVEAPNNDGNNKIGGSVYGATVEAGLKFTKMQFKAFLSYNQFADSKLKDAGEQEKRSSLEVGGQAQTFLNEKWLFDGFLSFSSLSDYRQGTDADYLDFPTTRSVRIAPQFTYLWDENLALFARWELSQAAKYTAKQEDGSDVDYGKVGYSKISIIARYQF